MAFRSVVLLSRSNRAPAIAVSSSEGFCRDGELWAILLIAAMIADERRVAGCAAKVLPFSFVAWVVFLVVGKGSRRTHKLALESRWCRVGFRRPPPSLRHAPLVPFGPSGPV